MYFILFFVLIGSIRSELSPDNLELLKSTISNNSCQFYSELDDIFPCGSQGYVQKFIYKYCMAYLENRDTFKNQAWQNAVRVCLQQKMLDYLEQNEDTTCAQVTKAGFDSHTECYIRPDVTQPELTFCRLPPDDIAKVIWIARGTVFEPAAWSQLSQLIQTCTSHIFQG